MSKIATYDRTLTGTHLKKSEAAPTRKPEQPTVQQNFLAVKNYQRGTSPGILSTSRDPSPASLNRNSYAFQDVSKPSYSRSNSPTQLSYNRFSGRSLSRETSPLHTATTVLSKFLTVQQGRSREPSPTGKYSSPSYSIHRYDHKLKSSPSLSLNSMPSNPCISYMTSSEASQALKARSSSRSRTRSSSSVTDSPSEHHTCYESTSKEIQKISAQIEALCNGSTTETSETSDSGKNIAGGSRNLRQESDSRIRPKIMVKIDVVHRATSPTHPLTFGENRWSELAQTVVASALRPFQPDTILIDATTQLDRALEDATRCVKVIYAPTYSPLHRSPSTQSSGSYGKSSDSLNARNVTGSSSSPSNNNYERIERSPMSPPCQSTEFDQLQNSFASCVSPQQFSLSPTDSYNQQQRTLRTSTESSEPYQMQILNGSPSPFRFSKSPGSIEATGQSDRQQSNNVSPFPGARSSQSPTLSRQAQRMSSPRLVKQRSSSTDSSDTTNKDFRKSVLNMSGGTNGYFKQDSIEGRSRSSSADYLEESEQTDSEPTVTGKIVQDIVKDVVQNVVQDAVQHENPSIINDNNEVQKTYQYNPYQANFMLRAFNNDQCTIKRYKSPTPPDSEWLGACFQNDKKSSTPSKPPTPVRSPVYSKPDTPESLRGIKSPEGSRPEEPGVYISDRYRDIDDLLGFMPGLSQGLFTNEKPPEGFQEISVDQVKIHEAQTYFGGHLPAR